jgi:hypothetical protein
VIGFFRPGRRTDDAARCIDGIRLDQYCGHCDHRSRVTADPPGADLYDRDDVDEMTLGQLHVLRQARDALAAPGPLSKAEAVGVVDAVALSLAPDDDDPDADGT